jgi:glucosamine-6-phosphate deaminase
MKIFCYENKQLAGIGAAAAIVDVVKNNPEAVLGLATGSSPIPMYNSLIERYKSGEVSFKNVKSVNLDEYVGLQPTHPMSYAYFMRENLFDSIDIDLANTNVPSGVSGDPAAECLRYDALIESLGGVDVQVLGIGHNGHIAFNEPSDTFSEGTQCVTLTDSTIDANARFFDSRDDVPRYAISMGIGAICKSKKIILIANGTDKAPILEKALFGEVTPMVPASILKTLPDVEVYADRDALSVILEKHPEAVVFG